MSALVVVRESPPGAQILGRSSSRTPREDIMKMHTVLLLLSGLAILLPYTASAQCSSADFSITQTDVGICSSAGEQKAGAEQYSLRVLTACDDSGWHSQVTGGPTNHTIGGEGQCGPQQTGGPPQCPVLFDTVTPISQGGGVWKFYFGWHNQVASGSSCVSTFASDDLDVDGEECTGTVCCSQSSVCTSQAGKDWDPSNCRCYGTSTPLIIDIRGDGYRLTDAKNGVLFDLDGSGERVSVAWTSQGSDDAFLVLDRNANGAIDDGGELFGAATVQAPGARHNGFEALRLLDTNGDGVISVADREFVALQLWTDENHNGKSEADELVSLRQAGIGEISLDYVETKIRDNHGNVFRYKAALRAAGLVGKFIFDVYLNRPEVTATRK